MDATRDKETTQLPHTPPYFFLTCALVVLLIQVFIFFDILPSLSLFIFILLLLELFHPYTHFLYPIPIMSKIFTQADVSSHNKPDSLWIVVDGDVYDVTKFADDHPGMFMRKLPSSASPEGAA